MPVEEETRFSNWCRSLCNRDPLPELKDEDDNEEKDAQFVVEADSNVLDFYYL